MPPLLTRRSLLTALGLAPLGGCIVGGNPPLPHGRLREITLDVRPIAAKGLAGYAEKVAALGRPALERAFVDMLAPNDPRAGVATLRVDEIRLASGSGDGEFPPAESDEFTGRLEVAAIDGLPALSRPIRATRAPGDAGPWYLPDIDDRRLAGLLALAATWARREFPE